MTDEELIEIYEQATGCSFPPEFVLESEGLAAIRNLYAAGRADLLKPGSLNYWSERCNAASREAGWWANADSFPVNLVKAQKIALMHSELSEALEGVRKSLRDEHLPGRFAEEVEMADLLIRVFDYAGQYGLDLQNAVLEKMAYNRQRADHKAEGRAAAGGKKF